MPTFFDIHTTSFGACLIVNNEVETASFLAACDVLVILLESLGTAFVPVKNDISGNIAKLKTKYSSNPEMNKTLQQIVINEKKEKNKVATDALLWLKRALEFTSTALRLNLTTKEELSASFSNAYSKTLSKHHSFLIRPVFSVAMAACPSRAAFFQTLAKDADPKRVEDQLDKWLKDLEERLANVVAFYIAEKLEK